MRKVLCVNKHYFDADRFNMCPICGAIDYRDLSNESDSPTGTGRSATPKKTVPDTELVSHTSKKEWHLHQPEEDTEPKDAPKETEDVSGDMASLKTEIEKTKSTKRKELPVTVRKWDLDNTVPPVGWLIGIVGPYLGKSFECISGRNHIGRSDDMEITLSKDPEVSRESHAILTYEPNRQKFYIQAGEGRGIVYLNGEPVFSHSELHAYDKFRLGGSEFVFLPLCGEHFTWDDYMNKEQ